MFKLEPLLGSENIKNGNVSIGKLNEFWGWSYSALFTPITRGFFAEYIVFKAINDASNDEFRLPLNYLSTKLEKDEPDLITYLYDNKMTIQVKSTDNINDMSAFKFKKTKGYNHRTDRDDLVKAHHCDLFVFCYLQLDKEKHNEIEKLRKKWNEGSSTNINEQDITSYTSIQNELNMSVLDMFKWEFYVCHANIFENQESIRISKLDKLVKDNSIVKCSYSGLHEAIKNQHVKKSN